MFFCLHLRKCCSCFCSFLWGINYSGFIALTGVSGNSNWRNSKTLSSFPSFLLLQIPLWKTQGSVLGLSQVPIHLPNEVPSARAPKSSSGDSESVAALPSPAPLCPALLYRHLSLTPGGTGLLWKSEMRLLPLDRAWGYGAALLYCLLTLGKVHTNRDTWACKVPRLMLCQ